MTYPPQQPGQPGSQDPYGQQQPWAGYPQQGPPSGPQPQPGQQPPSYGQPQPGYAPYGQQQPSGYPGGGYPGAGFPGAPPKKNKTGLIVGIAIGAVVLLGGGVTLLVVLLSGGDDPRAVAEQGAEALNTGNVELAKSISCDPSEITQENFNRAQEQGLHVKVVGDAVINGDEATVPVEVTEGGKTEREEFNLEKRDDGWCLD